MWNRKDRRQFLRRSCHLIAHVEIKGKEPVEAIIRNIGGGGADLITKEQLKVTSTVGIEFLLPGEDQSIKCQGEVTWYQEHHHLFPHKMTDYEVGIAFEGLEGDIRDRIVRFTHNIISTGNEK